MSVLSSYCTVLHPTDFTADSEQAFVHALKIATCAQRGGRFTMIHASPEDETGTHASRFPSVRSTLEKWGTLAPGSQREDVFNQLGLSIDKVAVRGSSVVSAINDYLSAHPVDLLVLATQGREGLPRLIRPSVSERLAQLSKTPALFVPAGGRSFVSPDDGSAQLRRILIPVAVEPKAGAAVQAACTVARMLSSVSVEITLLHVGNDGAMPELRLVADHRFEWRRVTRAGDVVERISTAAEEDEIDLIAMSTFGHHGFLDVLRGSTTEQVVRRSPCPVLAAPVAAQAQRIPRLAFENGGIAPSPA